MVKPQVSTPISFEMSGQVSEECEFDQLVCIILQFIIVGMEAFKKRTVL